MTLTREQVQAYLELASEATPGPWKSGMYTDIEESSGKWVIREAGKGPNIDFIIASRTIAPQLAEALLQAWDENAVMLDALESIESWMDGVELDLWEKEIQTRVSKAIAKVKGGTTDDQH